MALVAISTADSAEGTVSDLGAGILIVAFAIGAAISQVILSNNYVALSPGVPYAWALKRFVPWVVTVVLAFAIMFLGLFALIIPGIYLSLRLFWADEFALIHGAGPIQALKESWMLTESSAGAIFSFQFLAGLAAYGVIIVVGLVMGGVRVLLESASAFLDLELLQMAFIYWGILLGYSGLHAPEIVYLYGMRAEAETTAHELGKPLGV